MEGWKLMNQLNSVVITWYIFVLISPYSQKGTDATTNLDEEGNCVNSANPNGRKARRVNGNQSFKNTNKILINFGEKRESRIKL